MLAREVAQFPNDPRPAAGIAALAFLKWFAGHPDIPLFSATVRR
jgi:hypothetical protein